MAKYYLYNDVKLLALPDIDTATYPYLHIERVLTGYFLFAEKEPVFAGEIYNAAGTEIWGSFPVYPDAKCWMLKSGAWEEGWKERDDREGLQGTLFPMWSNHDIIGDETGTVYLAASDPVPVGGEPEEPETPEQPTLTERDLYRKINGKPTKLTLYKKVGGELVALDEYSAVSATAVQSNT